MKKSFAHIVIIVTTFSLAVVALTVAPRRSHGQARSRKTESPVKPTARVRPAATFAAAAARNATLKHELSWTFGGKQQRGWYLYDLLIRETLNTKSDAASDNFAFALDLWQQSMGLNPTGVLDEDSLMVMVSHWQNRRLKDRTIVESNQLITAPSSDFYDPERLVELRQVERNTYAAYKKMVAAAIADPVLRLARSPAGGLAPGEKYFKIISAFRSREYQERLRRESPNAGSAGLAVNSPHFTGRALDLYVGGEPVDTKDSNRALQVNGPAYRWLLRNAERFGFRPYFYEPWHWEYVR